MTDALPDILKALEAAEDSMGDAVDALEQCNKDLTMSAADRAELSRFSNDLQQQSKALAALTDELRGYIESDDVNSALACLVNVADVLSAMASDMSGITGLLTDYLQTAVPKAHEDIQRALRALDGTSGSLGSALRQARKLIEEFNERDELTFYPLGEGYQSTLDSLFSNLRSTMNELDGLSDEVSADGTTLTADLWI